MKHKMQKGSKHMMPGMPMNGGKAKKRGKAKSKKRK